ncbi:Hypothetical Protein SLY_0844 [Strawberry lethal yellows phytoplasma (CPA) str. NZSb11]|uniref:Uncharacterized protein n=1 Tax=Strawberry lethal yellows phytoplasma (CPA) str. NZSb11 TaxID=980422 RepID=R4S1R2_PHYAS|nr:Hypothetical Protein SLY_0844 [Strawberry lethal yellows phytoplasma (CPA) str. NZSb11]
MHKLKNNFLIWLQNVFLKKHVLISKITNKKYPNFFSSPP